MRCTDNIRDSGRVGSTIRGRNSVCLDRHADMGGAIGADVVLVGAELASLRGHSFQFLLGGSISISDIHNHRRVVAFSRNGKAVETLDDLVTDFTALEPAY